MTDLEAVLALIKAEPSIETLLGRWKDRDGVNTIYPMALIGTFPEEQSNLPAISLRGTTKSVPYGVTSSNITVSCYAETEFKGQQLAIAVNEYFRDSQGGVPGFSARFESDITGNVNDVNQSGIIVELRLTYR